jgi:hypothetical protein
MSIFKKTMNIFFTTNIDIAFDAILGGLLLIIIIARFVPFYPYIPTSELDSSWQFGMNQALAQGLSFGKDIIFTFGPYASIYTKSYHPSTDFLMVSGSLYLALSYWACFVILMKGVQWRWILAFYFIFAGGFWWLTDALFLLFPLLVGLLIFKISFSEQGKLVNSKLASFYVALLFAPFGLLPLIKGSMLILCGAVAAFCSVFFIANRHRLLAIICLCSPMVSMLFFWIASGQSAVGLPSYFISMAPIVSGYTEAMAVDGNIYEIILYLITSAFLLLAISIHAQITNTSKIFLFCIYFVFLFISFKAGFVRHDGHAYISGMSILIASLLLPFIFNTKIILPVIVFALLTWSYIDSHYIRTSAESIAKNFKSTYLSMWDGITNRIKNRNWPKTEFDARMNLLREQASFPVMQGATDIYSYNQSYLIASGNIWSPRPIFQSYSVYTPVLAEANKKHLLGEKAPENIIFRVEPIDGRIPSIEDGASWPVLLVNYQPTRMENDFLFLRKNRGHQIEEPLKISREMHSFGEGVFLPHTSQPVFAQIEIKPTILGRIASIFFKPSQIQIMLEMNNGEKKQYRIISGMSKSGFLISPLIENTAEFWMLYGKTGCLDGKVVKSIAIASRDSIIELWNNKYTITFRQIKTGTYQEFYPQ